MIDLCLRAGNAGALASACPFLRGEDDAGERFWIAAGEGFALDVIGHVVTTPGEYDADGVEIVPPVIDERFHANLRCTDEIAELVPETMIVTPGNPVRVWA